MLDPWLPSATEEQLNWTLTNTSASPAYVCTMGCTFSLKYQAGIAQEIVCKLSGLPLYPPSNTYTVVLFHSDHCSLTYGCPTARYAAAIPLTANYLNNKQEIKKKQTIFNISKIPFRSSFIETSLLSCNQDWRRAAEGEKTRHRILVGTQILAPEPSEILQQIQDPLLLALPKLLVLPIPDVLRVLCGGESRQTTGFE